jgi:hypothetical protein
MAMGLAWTAEAAGETIQAKDVEAIEACVRDSFDGWFDGDADRMDRALDPHLAKFAVGQNPDRSRVQVTSRDEVVRFTREGRGRARAADGRAPRIDATSVLDAIASVTVRSTVYDEVLLLARTPNGWRIMASLWRWAAGHGPSA